MSNKIKNLDDAIARARGYGTPTYMYLVHEIMDLQSKLYVTECGADAKERGYIAAIKGLQARQS